MVSEGFLSTAQKVALLTVSIGIGSASPLLAEEAPLFSYRKPQAAEQQPANFEQPSFETNRQNTFPPVEMHSDPALQQAAHTVQVVDPQRDLRRLVRPQSSATEAQGQAASAPEGIAMPFAQLKSLASAGAGLGIVIGLFLLCMWLLRRSGPRPTSALPQEAVAVLGRVPLTAQHFAHLIQVGRKLALVSVTSEGVSPITEVSDPQEVDRLLGLCMRNGPQSSTAQFQQVLQQLGREPAQGFLGGEEQGRAGKS